MARQEPAQTGLYRILRAFLRDGPRIFAAFGVFAAVGRIGLEGATDIADKMRRELDTRLDPATRKLFNLGVKALTAAEEEEEPTEATEPTEPTEAPPPVATEAPPPVPTEAPALTIAPPLSEVA